MAISLINRYNSYFSEGVEDNLVRQRKSASITGLLGLFPHLFLIFYFLVIDVGVMAFLNIGSVIAWTIHLLLLKKHYWVATVISGIEMILHAILCVHFIGWGYGFQFHLFTILIITVLNEYRTNFVRIFMYLLPVASFVMLYVYSRFFPAVWTGNVLMMNITYSINIIWFTCILVFLILYYKTLSDNAEKKLMESNTKLDRATDNLKRYLPLQLVNSIIAGGQVASAISERKKLTIFFSDIKGFTEITDSMEPEELSLMLNEYITEMTAIAHKWEGTIDKFVGDAMMVLFGTSESTDDKEQALKCVKMAIDMQDKMSVLKDKWFRSGIDTLLEIRIGINTGITAVGSFGTADRLSYTAIGGQVNLASRLESLAEPRGILISHSTWGLVNSEIVCQQRKDRIEVKGLNKKILVYDVLVS